MAKLVILCGHPVDPAAFEEDYANRHIPYAVERMPNVRRGENMQVLSTSDGGPALCWQAPADLRACAGFPPLTAPPQEAHLET